MQARKASEYVQLGTYHWFVQGVQAGTLVHGDQGVLSFINQWLTSVEAFGLKVTAGAAWKLNGIRQQWTELPEDARLTQEMARELNAIMREAEVALAAESGTQNVFVATDKRYDPGKLLYSFGALFRKNVFFGLPDLAMRDLQQAGRCIAFELPTASAFHLLRGTEQILRHYYSCVVRRSRLRKPWLWKPMTDALRARRSPPPKPLLDNLESLRINFRNPTAHPEKSYDIDEAQDLLAACIDVINRMAATPEWAEPTDSFSNQLAALAQAASTPAPPQS